MTGNPLWKLLNMSRRRKFVVAAGILMALFFLFWNERALLHRPSGPSSSLVFHVLPGTTFRSVVFELSREGVTGYPDSLVLTAQRIGIDLTAMLVRNKIQVRNRLGVEDSSKRLSARIVDGSWRQPMIPVCIIGGVDLQIPRMKLTPSVQRIDHRRIALKLHVPIQTIDENGRHDGHVLGVSRFLLDDGSQCHQVFFGKTRRAGGILADGLKHGSETGNHHLKDVFC